MSDNKKYYYMRLKENFYDSNEIVLLESMQDGYLYSNILLKLYLRSLKSDGKLMFNDRIPYSPSMIATITKHQVGTIEKALKIFQEMGLMEILDNGAIYMLDIQNFIGLSSTEADRIRFQRAKIQEEKKALEQMSDKCTPKIEIELELEIKKEIYSAKDTSDFDKEKGFDYFWEQYPKKANKAKSKVAFIRLCKNEDIFKNIMSALEKHKKTEQWKLYKYIPHPTTWLNGERWNDEVEDGGIDDARDKELDSIVANSGITRL